MKGIKRGFLLLLPLISIVCCASVSFTGDESALSFEQKVFTSMIVDAARGYVGKSTLVARGKHFNSDCTGGVMACYYSAGVDLWEIMAPYSGNGVKRLFFALNDRKLVNRSPYPVPGDLVFWDNTWDKNGNGKFDDYYTHVGLVVSSDDEGNIEYFHHHISLGFVIENMNLNKPNVHRDTIDGKSVVINSGMRVADSTRSSAWLADELCRGFGQAWKISKPD